MRETGRRAHYIRDNFESAYPQQCIWFDCETYFTDTDGNVVLETDAIWARMDYEHKTRKGYTLYHWLKVGQACYMRLHRNEQWTDEQWLRFTTRDQFWRWVLSKTRTQTKLYLFCHNTSYDLPVLDVFKELPTRGFALKSAIIDAPPTILRFRCDTRTILILDTLNFFRMPLKELAKEIGTEKYKMPEDNDLGVDWDTYNKQDVIIMRDACLKWWEFLRKEDLGSFAPTLAGQAMRAYRHKYMTHKIFCDTNQNALALTREGYFGGRNECFRIGRFRGHFKLLDVNSMYPHVMATKEYPYKLLSYYRHVSLQELSAWLQKYAVCARVLLRTSIPFAPVRRDHKLIFPIGEFECCLSTPELQYALAYSDILQVQEAAIYERGFLFVTMMNDLYYKRIQYRQQGNLVYAFLMRKMINSFYGKWGQDGGKWEEKGQIDDLSARSWPDIDYDKRTVTWKRQLGGLLQEKSHEAESRDSFPAIAGHVTAYARMLLWSRIQLCPSSGVYYCDTDSILCDNEATSYLNQYIDSEVMGQMSIKGEYDEIEIYGPKDYRFGSKSKTKGARKDAVWVSNNEIFQQQWAGLRGLVSSGVVDRPLTRVIRKELTRLYDKGTVLQDGRVIPILLPESVNQ